jgi:hypothetical protein
MTVHNDHGDYYYGGGGILCALFRRRNKVNNNLGIASSWKAVTWTAEHGRLTSK